MLLRLLSGLMRRSPSASDAEGSVEYLLKRAEIAQASGKTADAISACRKLLEHDPVNAAAHRLLARLEMPGDYYRDVLKRIHEHLRPSTYLEIGVSKGDTISLARPETLAIGLDPQPRIDRPLSPRTKIFAETSDGFFAKHDVTAELGGRAIELAMIDGMHHFEFALRDFINVERHCTPASTVLVHDCYPLDEISARRQRVSQFWSGDIWKLILCLKKYRHDLAINTIACAPTGLALIRKLDPGSTILAERLDQVTAEYLDLPYSTVGTKKAELLNLFPNDWVRVQALLTQ